MRRAKTIDRLELTRRSSKHLQQRDNPVPEQQDIPLEAQTHGDICPKCGQHTLHHVEACETCVACGYSACGLDK